MGGWVGGWVGGTYSFSAASHTHVREAVLEEEEGVANGVGAGGTGGDGAVVGALETCLGG